MGRKKKDPMAIQDVQIECECGSLKGIYHPAKSEKEEFTICIVCGTKNKRFKGKAK